MSFIIQLYLLQPEKTTGGCWKLSTGNSKNKPEFTFIDLFAGIGGIRKALENVGGECVFASEWDEKARITYQANFDELPAGDIKKIKPAEIPSHDVLAAGFPCQPFSLAGISKKESMNRPVGFKDPEQGRSFFQILKIVKEKKPKAILLENVKHLRNHNRGKTYKTIERSLKKLGYDVHDEILDAKYLVPQHRERLFIVAFRKKTDFKFPAFRNGNTKKLKEILESKPDKKYTLTPGVWNALKKHSAKHRKKGNGFGYKIADPHGITRTLSARYYKDGAEILISQGRGKRPRRLSPRECARIMGYKDSFKFEQVSDNQAYKQLGNSVVIPLVECIARKMVKHL